ncbi:kinase-like domain-containing protein [Tricharina praecox]|uniref:kinase-like domain-containing protein n=1 Tax=Tricharina praecox TaxID=43433 RepID=UPI002220C925|nr:kinase-like domain-containing protein [Tricharina praecox]KAI5846871.1 kinase-like domain-containing protein [Tricharina praecox]
MATPLTDKGTQVREQAEKACLHENSLVPPSIPYTVIDLVGKGSFGSVFKGIHTPTNAVVAIKSLDLDQHDEEIRDIQKEIGLLTQLKAGDAPNITAFHNSYVLGTKLWIVMDFCSGGSMRTLMKAGPIEERYIGVVIREALVALSYLHAQGIIHRDIKAANILVNQDGRVQLCDFGVSAQLAGKNNKRNTFVGTPQWMAPEALAGGLYDSKIDIWSFGITIYELAKQNPPLYQYHPERVVDMIPRMPPPRLEGGNWSNGLREFVAMCLNEIPDQRPPAEELQRSKFVKANKSPTAIMRELIVRYEQWERGGGVRASMLYAPGMGGGMGDTVTSDSTESAWDFDTVKNRISGVPKEFEMLQVVATQTFRSGPQLTRQPSIHTGARPRGAEKLYRLFETPGEEQPWDEEPPQDTYQANGPGGSMTPIQTHNGSSSSLGMISIPSFDDNGMMVSNNNNNNNNNIRARTPSPIGMISMPTEEEMMDMARQKAAAAAAAAAASPPTPSVAPIAPTITRTRPYMADSVGPSTPIDAPSTPSTITPHNFNRDPSPRRQIVATSAPSSPPRFAGQLQTASANTANKPHHLSSKSVPTFAGRPPDIAPPVPTLATPNPKVRSADSTPIPHLKTRSQDITARTPSPRVAGGGKLASRPSHLNLVASNGSNFDRLQPIRQAQPDWGSLDFPLMKPLDTAILSSPGGGEMMRELDRVLTGLGDALEVVEVGLRTLHKDRRQKVPADVEE